MDSQAAQHTATTRIEAHNSDSFIALYYVKERQRCAMMLLLLLCFRRNQIQPTVVVTRMTLIASATESC